MAAWKARRGSARVRLNETFTAKFQRLNTRLTWRSLGWRGARPTWSVESLPPSSFDLHRFLEWSLRCAGCSGTLTHPAAEGVAHPYVLLPQYALSRRLLIRGPKGGVAGSLSARTTYDPFSLSKSATDLASVTFAVEKRTVGPKSAEVAVATVPPTVAHRSGRRTEGRTLLGWPT